MPTVPNLDQETRYLSDSELNEVVRELPEDKGLYVVSFESGFGEYYDFIRRTAPIIAQPKPFEHFRGTNGAITGYPLDSVLSIVRSDQARDIVLTPLKRMPKWGDGSIHYSCSQCHRPCIFEEAEYESGKIYHEECYELIKD